MIIVLIIIRSIIANKHKTTINFPLLAKLNKPILIKNPYKLAISLQLNANIDSFLLNKIVKT